MSFPSDYPLAPFRDAATSVIGALFFSTLACITASSIVTGITFWDDLHFDGDTFWVLSLSWIGQWIISGIALYGLLFALVHCWCIHELLHGSRDFLFVLIIVFLNQTIISTSSIMILYDNEFNHPLPAGVFNFFLGGAALLLLRKLKFDSINKDLTSS